MPNQYPGFAGFVKTALGGNSGPSDEFLSYVRASSMARKADYDARRALDEAQNAQIQRLARESIRAADIEAAQNGDTAAMARLGEATLRTAPTPNLRLYTGGAQDFQKMRFRQQASEAAAAGRLGEANAALWGVASGPQRVNAIDNGYQLNPFEVGGAATATPTENARIAEIGARKSVSDAKAAAGGFRPSAGGAGVGFGVNQDAGLPAGAIKTGNDYLSSLPQQTAAQVKALAEGRMQFPSGTALKSPYWQGMLSAVSQYDPSFDAVNYNARSNTRKGFTSGKEAQTVNALNTVAEHLGTLSDNAVALHNFSSFGAFTKTANRLKNSYLEASGDPRIARFNTSKKAVADEVAKVWRASGGSEKDIQENLKNLDGAQSPEQLNAAIGTLTNLIYGKIAALQDQYTTGMGQTQNPRPLVSPEAQKAFDKTIARMNGVESGAQVNKPQRPAASGGWKIEVVN